MTTWAKIVNDTLIHPTTSEFKGVPNWQQHSVLLRKHGYMPQQEFDDPQPPEGDYTREPATWHIVEQSITRVEPRREDPVTHEPFMEDIYEEDPETHEMKKTGERQITKDVPVTYDTSYIQIDSYKYTPVVPPEPSYTVDDYNNELEGYLTEVRYARGYTDRDPSEYYNSTVPRWHQDAVDWIQFRDVVMVYGLSILNEYQATGEAPVTLDEFREHLRTIPCEWHD